MLWRKMEKEGKSEKEVLSKMQTLLKRWNAEYGVIRVNSRPVPATPSPSSKKLIEQPTRSAGQIHLKSTPSIERRPLPPDATAGPSNLRPQTVGASTDEALARRLQEAWNEPSGGQTFEMLNRDEEQDQMSTPEDSPMQLEDETRPGAEEPVAEPEIRKGKGKAKFDDDDYIEGAEQSKKKGKGKGKMKGNSRFQPRSKGEKTDAEKKHTRPPPIPMGSHFKDPCEKCAALKERCEIDRHAGEHGPCSRCRQKKIRCSKLPPRTNLRTPGTGLSKPVATDTEDEAEPRVTGNPPGDRPARRAAEEARLKARILLAAENLIDKKGRKKPELMTKSRLLAQDALTERVEEVVKGESRILIILTLVYCCLFRQDICKVWPMSTRNPPIFADSSLSSVVP